jgi:rare lipoprotein A
MKIPNPNKILLNLLVFLGFTFGIILISGFDKSEVKLKEFNPEELFTQLSQGHIKNDKIMLSNPDSFEPLAKDVEKITKELNIKVEPKLKEISKSHSDNILLMRGTASHYADKFHGRQTASGEIFNMYDYSCAHKTLPFGTILKITNRVNGESVLVKVNDRGPYVNDRIIDLSYKAAKEIGNLGLPKIQAEGFNHKNFSVRDSTHYLAYSSEKDLNIIPKSDVKILSKTNDFNQAISFYKNLKSNSAINSAYIFIEANKKYHKNSEYCVGYVKPEVLFASQK